MRRVLLSLLVSSCQPAPAATIEAPSVDGAVVEAQQMVASAVPARSPSERQAPGSMLDLAKFYNLFTDIPFASDFVADRGIATIRVVEDGELVQEMVFDEAGRLLEQRELSGGEPIWTTVNVIAGGLVQRRTDTHHGSGEVKVTTFSYDGDQRPVQEITRLGGVSTTTFAYDGDHLVEAVRVAPSALVPEVNRTDTMRYAYSAEGRLARDVVTLDSGREIRTDYRYDPTGRLLEVERVGAYANAVDRYLLSYDERGLLARVTFFESQRLIAEHVYAHDEEGRLLAREQVSHVPAMGNHTRRYSYETRP